MSWALKVFVPLSKASRGVMVHLTRKSDVRLGSQDDLHNGNLRETHRNAILSQIRSGNQEPSTARVGGGSNKLVHQKDPPLPFFPQPFPFGVPGNGGGIAF